MWSAPFSWLLRLCWFMINRTSNITVGVCLSWFCACVGLWFIERGILHLECASLAVRIVRIE